MYRKHFFMILIAAVMLCLGGLSAFAQTNAVRGTVKLKQADGTTVLVPNAIVDVYRLDIAGKSENNKTNKRGEFHIIGLFIVGKYILSISAPGAQPFIKGGIKPGQNVDVPIVLEAGDGTRYTMEQAKELANSDSAGAKGGGGGESAEARAEREEKMRKNAEITARNAKAGEIDATISRTFKAGRAAMNAGKFDEAIAQYNEGLAADPDQYTLLSDKALALKSRGFDSYLESGKAGSDQVKRQSLLDAAKKDLKDAADASKKSYDLLMAVTAPANDQAAMANYVANKLAILDIRAEVMRLFAMIVDQTQGEMAFSAIEEFLAVETKPDRILRTRLLAADMLRSTGNWEKATAEYKKILLVSPDNVEALRGVGLSLFGAPDESTYQEAVDWLQRFVDKAPDTHPDKAEAKAIIEEMKKKDIKPQKSTTGKKRG